MRPHFALALLIAVLAAAAPAGCGGGSGDQTVSVGKETITVPSDTHGVYAELAAILDQLPYRPWYAKCVVAQVEKVLSPAEAEELAKLPEAEREAKAMKITAEAGPRCEAESDRPVVDPHASTKELDLLRAGYVTSMTALAEAGGADADQLACIENNVENLPEKNLIGIGNGSKTVREGILLSIFKPCAKT
ncbi:MAG TPA: hypothetical protein VHA80_06865 [Solirubrobacterales bacterium]|nr:hypothetical protein [Solirubrobacterales bacterium]